jgi:tetratricopeptide (TPR) repeat protein
MAQHTGDEKSGAKKRTPKRRRDGKAKTPKVQAGAGSRAAGGEQTGPFPPPPAADWSQFADRAAKKVSELLEKARPYVDKARPAAEKASEAGKRMAVDLSGGLEEAFAKISEQARDLAAKGQHTRVRIKFRGRQLAELPIAVVAAAEVASLWWFGPLRLLLGHVVGKAALDVEFVSSADHHVEAGRALLADGEVDKALQEFDRALAMDRRCAGAHLGRGIALKLRGDKASAREAFERAIEADPRGEAGREARRHLDNLG